MVRVIPKITGEELCKAVERSKLLTAEQVVKNKSGEEVLFTNYINLILVYYLRSLREFC